MRTAIVSGAKNEVPRFVDPGKALLRADIALAHTAHLNPASARRPASSDRTPVLLPQSLYRSVDYRYWLVAVGGGILAWWVLFHFL